VYMSRQEPRAARSRGGGSADMVSTRFTSVTTVSIIGVEVYAHTVRFCFVSVSRSLPVDYGRVSNTNMLSTL